MKPGISGRELMGMTIGLAIQFLLGMYVNLFMNFPKTGIGDDWHYAWGHAVIAIHIILGSALFLGGIAVLIRSVARKNRRMVLVTSIGLFGMVLSLLGGESFISTQNELLSYLMAFGFLISILAYNWGLARG